MQKRILISAVSILIFVQLCFAESSLLSKSDAGTITGKVIDAKEKPVAGVVVILCDQSSGIPVCKDTFRLFTDAFLTKEGNQQNEIYFVVTDGLGCFSFEKVPVGEYRLVAQSWRDAKEFKGIWEKTGKEIELHGIAKKIQVVSGNSANVVLRPLGTGVLRIENAASGTYFVISTSPTRADPILGFAGWGGGFMQNMLGGNRMIGGQTTVYGLPEGRLYLAFFSADNIPGCAEEAVEIRPNETTILNHIQYVNSWSNSRHYPPEHLVPVFEEVKQLISQRDNFIFNLYQNSGIEIERSKGMLVFMAQLGPHLGKEVELPSGRKATFGEVMAAAQYVQLERTMERKKEQWKKHDEAMKKFSDRRAAKKAMAQKEQVRIRETVDISSPSSFFPDDAQAGEELDELWAVKNHAFNTVSSEEIFEIVRKGFRGTSAKKNDIIGTIGSKFIWHKKPSVQSAVDILYCASFEPDVKYNAFYYGLTVANPKSPEVLKRLVELAMQGYGVGRIAWGILVVQNQREEFVNLLKPYLNSNDSTERQQAQNVMRVIEGKSSGVYSTGIGETNPEDIEKVKKDFGDKLGQIKQILLTGTSSLRLMELERICSLNTCILFDDTFISGIQACAQDKNPKVRIKAAEVAGYYWIWGDTITNPKITRLLIQLSEDEVQEVRFATVEKGLFNIPNKTKDVIKLIIEITLTEQKEIPEKLYGRIQYVLRVNGGKTRTILQEYLEDDEYDQGSIATLYRNALRSDPPIVEKK